LTSRARSTGSRPAACAPTSEAALAAGRRVRQLNALDGATPVVVIAEKYGEGLEGTDVPAGEGEWVTYMEDSTQLHALLSRLTVG
jgi:hypothetical protein